MVACQAGEAGRTHRSCDAEALAVHAPHFVVVVVVVLGGCGLVSEFFRELRLMYQKLFVYVLVG
jgi:hypothetical protein